MTDMKDYLDSFMIGAEWVDSCLEAMKKVS